MARGRGGRMTMPTGHGRRMASPRADRTLLATATTRPRTMTWSFTLHALPRPYRRSRPRRRGYRPRRQLVRPRLVERAAHLVSAAHLGRPRVESAAHLGSPARLRPRVQDAAHLD